MLFTIVDDYRDEYGISESSIGIVIGIGFLAGFLSQLLIAPLADRGHARRIVLLGVLVNVIGLRADGAQHHAAADPARPLHQPVSASAPPYRPSGAS